MRQRLPGTAPGPLYVQDTQQVVSPGEEFDAPHLVPGCESLELSGDAADSGGQGSGEDDAPQDQAAGKSRARAKEAGR